MFSPGQYLSTSDITRQGASESSRVELIPITPKLISTTRTTQKRESLPAELLATPAEYRIGNNDVLYITVWDHPELTAPSGAQQQIDANGRLVRSDGTLYYPYIKEVQAAGRTIQQLRADIEQRLSAFIAEPQVDVAVLRFASQKVVVTGAVAKGGPQAISTNPLSVVEALGSAGIDTNNADLSGLTLTRNGRVYPRARSSRSTSVVCTRHRAPSCLRTASMRTSTTATPSSDSSARGAGGRSCSPAPPR